MRECYGRVAQGRRPALDRFPTELVSALTVLQPVRPTLGAPRCWLLLRERPATFFYGTGRARWRCIGRFSARSQRLGSTTHCGPCGTPITAPSSAARESGGCPHLRCARRIGSSDPCRANSRGEGASSGPHSIRIEPTYA